MTARQDTGSRRLPRRARTTNIELVRRCYFGARSTLRFFIPALLAAALLWPAQPARAQFVQQAKLFGTPILGALQIQEGWSVALSANGNTAIVGANQDADGLGAAWVFIRSNGVWTQQAKLVGTGAIGTFVFQGNSVALSSDGNTAIVGGPSDNDGAGAAWVFTRSGSTWTQQAKLVGSGAAGGGANQGWSVALSADGNTAIVGGPCDNGICTATSGGTGAAWVFTRSAGVWTQQGNKLVGTGAAGRAGQGSAVALSADGNTAVVGGQCDNGAAGCGIFTAPPTGVGAAWVFTRSNGVWSQQGNKLVGSGAVGVGGQGHAVALSGDGNTIVSGAVTDNGGIGAAWVFARVGGLFWVEQAQLIGAGAQGTANQGTSVALSGNGNLALVGGPFDNNGAGAAWLFTHVGGTWTQLGAKLVGTGAVSAAHQGFAVALSNDAKTAILGGPPDGDAGAAWVFLQPPTATHDFNADLRSDVLWWNATSGQTLIWQMNGAFVIGGGTPGSMATSSAIVGQRDFNGDGFADILWRNGTTGQLLIWLMNGTSMIGTGSPGTAASPWSVAGTGDFNGDGFGDVLWYNTTTGQVAIWFLNGTTVIGGGSPGMATSPWTIVGTGDFNGDKSTDILWYNTTTGEAVIWLLNGTSVIGGGSLGSTPNAWTIVGTGDFNGDGFSDLLWYNTASGQAVLWYLNGTTVIGSGSPGTAVSPWSIAQTGDYNGDGFADILWFNTTSRQVIVWLLNGATVLPATGSPGFAASPWQIQGMNAD